MSATPVEYVAPVTRAYERMKAQLFHPFDLSKWIAVGFTAWLVHLTEGGSPGLNLASSIGDAIEQEAEGSGLATAMAPWNDLLEKFSGPEAILAGLGLGCCLALVLAVLILIPILMWVSARGQFMFLDNVVHDRAEIAEPWRRFKVQGNSLFLFLLAFVGVALLALLAAAAPGIVWMTQAGEGAEFAELAPGLGLLALLVLPVVLALAYAGLFLVEFVVPIMHRDGLRTMDAWRRFLPIFKAHKGSFLVYGLWIFVLRLGVGLAILLGGLLTCCIGFIPLILPFVGTVVLLPVYVTFRALGLEFLGQFTPEERWFPEPPGAVPPPVPA